MVETKRGKYWGAYTDIPWKKEGGGQKGQGNSFVFRFDKENIAVFKPADGKAEVWHTENEIFSMGKPHLSNTTLSNRFKCLPGTDRNTIICGE